MIRNYCAFFFKKEKEIKILISSIMFPVVYPFQKSTQNACGFPPPSIIALFKKGRESFRLQTALSFYFSDAQPFCPNTHWRRNNTMYNAAFLSGNNFTDWCPGVKQSRLNNTEHRVSHVCLSTLRPPFSENDNFNKTSLSPKNPELD